MFDFYKIVKYILIANFVDEGGDLRCDCDSWWILLQRHQPKTYHRAP
jgi:hypothetical protein